MKKDYRNKVTDVKDVRVGRKTIAMDNVQIGAMIILPIGGGIFREGLTASCHVINGFGKADGLIQLKKLGMLESPITLTNTLCMGTVQQALVRYMLQDHPKVSTTSGTVNIMVGECNDGYLNGIRVCSIQESNVYEAIADVGRDFTLGVVGAGCGMSCFEMKGSIDLASGVLELDGEEYTVGLLILSSFGLENDYIKENVSFHDSVKEQVEQGSIIIILATDIPMSDRQLKRVCKRMPAALARFGSHLGSGSGDVAIAFSTVDKIPHSVDCSLISQTILYEQQIDKVFRAGIGVYEEAVRSFLDAAETVVGGEGHCKCSLRDTVTEVKRG